MTGGKLLQVPVKGYGLAPTLAATPQVMHLGVVPTYEWADQLLELCNKCQELPMHVRFDRSGPYFTVEPAQLDLPPAGSTCVLVRYLPKVGQEVATGLLQRPAPTLHYVPSTYLVIECLITAPQIANLSPVAPRHWVGTRPA